MQLPSTEAQIVSKGAYYQHDQYDHPIFNDELEENFLYHYTTLSSLVAIGNSGTLRASPFKNCNDPTERYQNNRTSIDGNFPNDSEARKDWFQEKNRGNSILDNIRRNAHVLCFSVDRLEKCGITRKGFAIPQMWAHYGDNRKGVCLIFARDQILTETKKMGQKYEARAIVYDTSQASGSTIKLNPIEIKKLSDDELRQECIARSPDLFWFYKDDGWKYEQEYRLVFPEPTDSFTYLPIQSSIKGICLGADFPLQGMQHVTTFKRKFCLEREMSPEIWWDKGIGIPRGISLKLPNSA